MTLTEAQLNQFVDQRYVERGRAHAEHGLVVLESVTDREANAYCIGGQVYSVRLTLSRRRLGGQCTCPAFGNFGPCKHIAAVALAVIAGADGGYAPSPAVLERVEESRALRERLLALEKAELVDLVLSLTSEEDLLRLLYDD